MSPDASDRQPVASTTVSSADSVSVSICELVSNASGTSIRELPPLGRVIDADALDDVFSSGTSQGRVAFRFAGYDVVVRSAGTIELYHETAVTTADADATGD